MQAVTLNGGYERKGESAHLWFTSDLGNHRWFMLSMKSLLNHKMWKLQLFSCWLCCSAPFVTQEFFLLEVACEIVTWRHECMQATIRQKRGKLIIYLAVISPFFGKSKHIFSLCPCLWFSYPQSTEGNKVGSKTLFGFDTNLIGQWQTNFRCVLSSTLYKVLTRNFQSDSFSLKDYRNTGKWIWLKFGNENLP